MDDVPCKLSLITNIECIRTRELPYINFLVTLSKLEAAVLLAATGGRDLQSRMSMNQMLTQDWWLRPKLAVSDLICIRCWCKSPFYMGKLVLHQDLTHLHPRVQVFPGSQKTCISIWCIWFRVCKFSSPTRGTLFLIECILCLPLPILAMYDVQNH